MCLVKAMLRVLIIILLANCHGIPNVEAAWVANDDGTVTDTVTGLIWQGQADGVCRNWESALEYCEAMNLDEKSDWRLPNIRELESIVDESRYGPAHDPVFQSTSNCSPNYWSSTSSLPNSDSAWVVIFYDTNYRDDGYVGNGPKSQKYQVRCVRGGAYIPTNQPPVIDSFTSNPSSGNAPLPVAFVCAAHDPDGTIATYTISYGDDSSSETNSSGTFTHTYAKPGNYVASVNVADNNGLSATPKTATIQIQGWSGLSISGKVTAEASPLSGVTVNLTGAATGTTQTDDSGLFGFSNLTSGVYTLTPSKDQYAFSPAKRSASLTSQSITGQDFTASLMPGAVHGVVHSNASNGPLLGGVLVTCGEKKAKTKSDGSYVIPKIPAGEHTLSFSKPGYQSTLEQVTIPPGQDVDAGSDTFLIANGVIKVIITPKKARQEGAQWQLDGGDWYPSGTMLPCAAGQHTITFKEIAGWGAPSPQIVTISPGNITSVQGTYIQGAVKVIIEPSAAITAGAQWQLNGGDWNNSGATLKNLPTGDYTITFKDISGWVTPEPKTITISLSKSISFTAVYINKKIQLYTFHDNSMKFVLGIKAVNTHNYAGAAITLNSGSGCWYTATPNYEQPGTPINKTNVYYIKPLLSG